MVSGIDISGRLLSSSALTQAGLSLVLFLAAMSSSRSDDVTQSVRPCVVLFLFWNISKMSVSSISRVFQECFKGVSRVFQGCFKGVSRVFQGCFRGVLTVVFQGWCFKGGVSRVFKVSLKGV